WLHVPALGAGAYAVRVTTAAGSSAPASFTIGTCVQPLLLTPDNTATAGLVTAILEQPVTVNGQTTAKVVIDNELQGIWMEVLDRPSALQPDATSPIRGLHFAQENTVPPDNAAD